MTPRLKEKYKKEVEPALRKQLGCKNPMQVPRFQKIVINVGTKATLDKDSLKEIAENLAKITGQKAVVTKSRKSIANFKLRDGMPIGVKVTLRGDRMFEFMDRLVNVALPRIRDFRGISATGFDKSGNYTLGLKEHDLFPEIDPDRVKVAHGMDITIVNTAANRTEALALLKLMGFPFAGE
ncbi:MAG TPA: 50S ribosomal protein L5 [Kiritimatiellia bacterium]|nr:50S ribosomal protein L5 [Kiritimatiellia bacterium]HNR93198.1 50S ribosomal protein L5 [Kiritimatiellia bacterium]HNS81166.1 50S ribosomal protein L5 [Kiritimatiellia bacterium]HPA77597.1 50S ribosomal protein L5 [Kiritimatiellia bacterium]HQQ03635.1 50S ribosomal protein L5 [Kiritimatiellia bacterium]